MTLLTLLKSATTGGGFMAVRAFTAAHALNTATGALATSTFGTHAIIVKRGATGSWHTFLAFHNSGGTALSQFAYNSTNTAAWWIDGVTVTGPAAIATTDWGLVVVRKASGTATPRFSLYNFSTDTWTHANASGTRSNWTAPGASGQVRFNWEGADQFVGRVAVRAAWNTVKWSADTTGDAALEAAGLETSLQAWVDADPDALWPFNQASTATAVTDITGGGADQVSITGTTVVTGDDPPGFDFTLGGGTTGTVAVTQAAQTSSASGQLGYSGTAAPSQAAQTSTASGKLGYSGTSARTQANQTSAATGQLGYTGTAAQTQASQTANASGSFTAGGSFTGTVAVTQANQTAAAAGKLGYTGTIAAPQAANTSTATGTVINPVTGSIAVSQASQTAAAIGVLRYTGTVAVSEASDIASIQGIFFIPITGTVAATQANQTSTASGTALGNIVERPFTGNTSRPTGGTTPRPFAGVTERP